MTGQALFWFHVEPVLTMIRESGEQAEQSLARRVAPDAEAGFGTPPILDEVTQVTGFGRPLTWAPGGTGIRAEDALSLDIVKLRRELREALLRVENRLEQEIGKRHTRNVMYPIVIHADERLKIATKGRAGAWAPLQLEFLDIDDGGDQFYRKLDELLIQPDTPAVVLAVYYYCLRDGFVGQAAGNPARIDDYLDRLRKRVHVDMEVRTAKAPDAGTVQLYEFPVRYYLMAAGAVLGTGLVFWMTGYLHTI